MDFETLAHKAGIWSDVYTNVKHNTKNLLYFAFKYFDIEELKSFFLYANWKTTVKVGKNPLLTVLCYLHWIVKKISGDILSTLSKLAFFLTKVVLFFHDGVTKHIIKVDQGLCGVWMTCRLFTGISCRQQVLGSINIRLLLSWNGINLISPSAASKIY
jgi:hypothetical protein